MSIRTGGDSSSSVKESFPRNTASVYLADEYRFHDRWSLNLGARYDKASDLEGNWSPRVALIYQPDFRTTLKASYSEAFRMPNADDRSFFGDGARPEYVAAKEFVVQHNLDRRMRAHRYRLRISAQQADGRRQRQRRLCGGGQQPGPGEANWSSRHAGTTACVGRPAQPGKTRAIPAGWMPSTPPICSASSSSPRPCRVTGCGPVLKRNTWVRA